MSLRPMRILFARHGESTANLLRVISNRDIPHPLTELGRRQAAALADAVRPEGVRRIFASPIPRAAETAEIVGRTLEVPVVLTDALREFDCGEYEGRSDAAAWATHAAVLREWLEHGRPDARVAGGESLTEVRARFDAFVGAVIRDLLAGTAEPGAGSPDAVLLITHGGTLRCVLPRLLDGVDPALSKAGFLANAEIIAADVRPDGSLVRGGLGS